MTVHSCAREIERPIEPLSGRDLGLVRFQRFLQRLSDAPRLSVDDANTGTLDGRERRNRADLAQSFLWAYRKIEPRRVCTVDHIQVVVAWEAKNETGDPQILHESAEELGPLRRTARISDVSGNQDKIELPANWRVSGVQSWRWISRVDRVQFGHYLFSFATCSENGGADQQARHRGVGRSDRIPFGCSDAARKEPF